MSAVAGFENHWLLYGVQKKYKSFPSCYLSIQKQCYVNVATYSLWALGISIYF